MTFWVTFKDGFAGCVETAHGVEGLTRDQEVKGIENLLKYSNAIKLHGEIVDVDYLPYPSEPRLIKIVWADHGAVPNFCFSPKTCKGRTSCPKSYSCTE